MQKLSPTAEGISKDILAENIAKLKELFPEVFAEGKIDFDALKQLLGEYVDDANERYSFTWNGKSQARRIAQTPSMGTLRPCPEESVNWDNTQNLFIEGDNLEVLKLLQKSYYKKIKMIYIDPPYNTGKEFIYPDNFRDSIKNYMELTGQTDTECHKLSTNAETSGRYHTDWLNMMYPRLKLARNLLRDDGVMIVHMDECEQCNLERLLGDIFGEENLLGIVIWDKRNPKGDAQAVAYQHESIFFLAREVEAFAEAGGLRRRKPKAAAMLAKARELFRQLGRERSPAELSAINAEFAEWVKGQNLSGGEAAYSSIDENGNVYQLVSMAWPNKKKAPPEYFTPLVHPVTGKVCPVPARGWRSPPETMRRLVAEGKVVFGADESTQPRRKYLLAENLDESFASVIYFGGSDDGLLASMGIPFDTPKPVAVAKILVDAAMGKDAIVLDFFSGSCTAAHAVLDLNKKDGGNRKFIMVQLPEPCDKDSEAFKAGYKTIADIGKERIRRVLKKLNEEDAKTTAKETQNPALFSSAEGGAASLADATGGTPIPPAPDRGFKVFKLDSSNIKTWDPDFNKLEHSLLNVTEPIKPERSEADVLYEILLKYGLDLTLPIEKREIGGKTVHIIGGGNLVVCLAMNMTLAVVEQIAALKDEFKPETPPGMRVVFKDAGFAGDELKTNAVQILKQHGIEDVRAL